MRKEVVAISSILVAALIAALVHAIVLGNLSQIFETVENTTNQTVSPKSTFIGPALSLVRTGSLGSGGKHIGFVQRGPGYAVALGGAFFLLGERMVAIFLVNLFSLLLTIFFLWRISARFLSGLWQYAPPFMLALFWEASAFVWLGSYELFTMAIATFAVFSFLKYHATQLDFSTREVISMYLSYAFGDLIGGVLYDGFPKDKEPRYWDAGVEKRIDETRDRGGSLIELDRVMYQDALNKIKEKPLKFFVTGFAGVFRLNSPMNYNTLELMRVLAGDNRSFPKGLRILLVLGVRLLWYGFLAVVSIAFIWHARDLKAWGLILGVILYYNIMYSLLTHAEVRYILTVMPFYFLLCAEGLYLISGGYRTHDKI